MEFMMTYGWAILAAVTAVGFLSYSGVFTPSIESKAVVTTPFLITGQSMTTGEETKIFMELIQNSGQTLVSDPMDITVTGQGANSGTLCANLNPYTFNHTETKLVELICDDEPNGNKFRGVIRIVYHISGQTFEQVSTGTILVEVTEEDGGSGGQSVECGNNIIESGEECDGTNMTATCSDLGFDDAGTVTCTNECTHNTTQCFSEYRIFATSGTWAGGAINGALGADAKCQAAAESGGGFEEGGGGQGGTWKAWISDSINPASNRLHHSDVPYKLLNNVSVAGNWTDLVDGTLSSAINRNENDALVIGSAWTGTTSSGTSTANNCGGWTSGAAQGDTGNVTSTTSAWSNNRRIGCGLETHRLYCIEQP